MIQFNMPRKFVLPLTNQISLSSYLYFVIIYWAICVLQLFVKPGCDVIKFEIKLALYFNQAVFSTWQKVKTKIQISWGQKKLLRWNERHF